MIVMQVQNLEKFYGADNIFSNISFIIKAGEKVGMVGPNGIGKSTLLKCLTKEEPFDSGEIIIGKNIKVGYLAQKDDTFTGEEKVIDIMLLEYKDLLDLREKIRDLEKKMSDPAVYEDEEKLHKVMENYSDCSEKYEKEGGYLFESKIKGILKGLGFEEEDFNRSISTFSGGQKTRLALVKLLLREPDLILLDEPTNYLDIDAVEWLEDYLAQYPGAVLVVSHDRYFLDKVVERILELDSNGITSYRGNYSEYLKKRERKLKSDLKLYNKEQEKIAEMEEYIRRYKAGIKSKQARGRQKILNRMERMKKPQITTKKPLISFNITEDTGEEVLKLTDIKKSYSEKTIFENLNLTIYKGEKVALLGKNGTGKSTLLKIIADKIDFEGDVKLGSRVKIAYYDQEHESLNENNTVLDEIYTGPHITEHEARSVLGRFLFSGEEVEKKVANLSGGEKARLVLAKLFLQEANFLILDEPTNHLDIKTREALEEALLEFEGTILFVSHDRYFINRLATRVIELENNELKNYLGNYDYYRWKKQDLLAEKLEKERLEKEKIKNKKKQENKKQTKKAPNKKIKIEEIESNIERLEKKVEELTALLGDTETYTNSGEEIKSLTEEYNLVNEELEKLYTLWEELLES